MSLRKISIVNPVGSGLDHYARSLEWVLSRAGANVDMLAIDEPSASGRGKVSWLVEYCYLLVRARRGGQGAHIIITWPVIGYWDFVIARILLGRGVTQLVIHDPEPLVRAKGYGWMARRMASLRFVRARPLVHSKAAAAVITAQASGLDVKLLPHPMFKPREPATSHSRPIIRVLGQYKPDRDTESLEELAAAGSHDWLYQIVGRGWATIPGWDVSARYVSEIEFTTLIRDSSVVLIPYTRFFQSGVAIRCLEMGTPIVGPRVSSLMELLGQESKWLVSNGSWRPAVEAALDADPQEVHLTAIRVYRHVLEQWCAWLADSSAR
jgi:hypothetical protein